jgi:hypothetical protein
MILIIRTLNIVMGNSHHLASDALGRKNKVDTSGFYRALGHIWLSGGLELLRDGALRDDLRSCMQSDCAHDP